METDNAIFLRQEFIRLEQLLRTVEYGTVGVSFIVHGRRIDRVIRSQDISLRPSGGRE